MKARPSMEVKGDAAIGNAEESVEAGARGGVCRVCISDSRYSGGRELIRFLDL